MVLYVGLRSLSMACVYSTARSIAMKEQTGRPSTFKPETRHPGLFENTYTSDYNTRRLVAGCG